MRTYTMPLPACLMIIFVSLLLCRMEQCGHDDSVKEQNDHYMAEKIFDARCSGASLENVNKLGMALFLDCGAGHAKAKVFTQQQEIIIEWAKNDDSVWNCAVARSGEADCKGSKK